MERTPFAVETGNGALAGWCAGDGPPVLALHGGPGLEYTYLDDAVLELAGHHRVATFQQRGLAPSTTTGEFTIPEAVADIVRVLDHLGWDTAHLMGHSWGGHLVLHAAVAIPERISGALAVDPLGAVGDGGSAAFGDELLARVTGPARDRVAHLMAKDEDGTATPDEAAEALSLYWPSYFADPAAAPPMPAVSLSHEAGERLWADLVTRLPDLEAALPSIGVPVGVLVGGASPMPTTAGSDTACRIPGAWLEVLPAAGHFVWHEAPGALAAAMDRLRSG